MEKPEDRVSDFLRKVAKWEQETCFKRQNAAKPGEKDLLEQVLNQPVFESGWDEDGRYCEILIEKLLSKALVEASSQANWQDLAREKLKEICTEYIATEVVEILCKSKLFTLSCASPSIYLQHVISSQMKEDHAITITKSNDGRHYKYDLIAQADCWKITRIHWRFTKNGKWQEMTYLN